MLFELDPLFEVSQVFLEFVHQTLRLILSHGSGAKDGVLVSEEGVIGVQTDLEEGLVENELVAGASELFERGDLLEPDEQVA